jgi:hypothetical protein
MRSLAIWSFRMEQTYGPAYPLTLSALLLYSFGNNFLGSISPARHGCSDVNAKVQARRY